MPTLTIYDEYKLHAVLYAKGRYCRDKNHTGLRVIAGHYAGMDPVYIDDQYLMTFALMLLREVKPNINTADFMLSCFMDCWKWQQDGTPIKSKGTIAYMDVVEEVMSQIRWITLNELPPLPQANPAVYLLANQDKESTHA